MSAGSRNIPISASEAELVADSAPNPELLNALGRLVRGLSALFWGLPIALVICVQTAQADWLRPLGIVPPIIATALLFYGLNLLGNFQKQERIWRYSLDRARIFGLINVGLSPFLYWWNKMPFHPFYNAIVELMAISSLLFLFALNPLLCRLTAMLPDETLRIETRLFTTLNRYLLLTTILLLAGYFAVIRIHQLPQQLLDFLLLMGRPVVWVLLFLILLPVAVTMALIWKIKEVILASIFGTEQ
jgi:hypothetical protein